MHTSTARIVKSPSKLSPSKSSKSKSRVPLLSRLVGSSTQHNGAGPRLTPKLDPFASHRQKLSCPSPSNPPVPTTLPEKASICQQVGEGQFGPTEEVQHGQFRAETESRKKVKTNHTIEWDAEHQFWVRRSLGHLGMVLELGHGGARCPKTLATTRKMTVVHEHGVWPMNVRFCGCPEGDGAPNPDAYQLLGAGLWPASWKQPLTAFSMSVMREFHLLSVQANTNAYDYFRYLQRTTDNITPDETKDRYREFLTAFREFSYLRLCKRNGEEPRREMEAGCLATLCPCCPHMGINMDPKWQKRKVCDRFLDALFHAVDGNFVSNQKDKKMDGDDFPLTLGAGYFANENDVQKFIADLGPFKVEHSTCHKFGAMGYAGHWGNVSGTVGLSCARHMFVLPGGGVDLQKGERANPWVKRFANVDFAMVSGLHRFMDLPMHVSAYDINCQYRINFDRRMEEFRTRGMEFASIRIRLKYFPWTIAGVGKFHLPAHKASCRYKYSFRYLPGVGMTDGEAVERIWASLNTLALRTREMASGHRHDTINDFQNDMNVRRVHGIGE
ncbi:hypothetical protein PHLCEN_2v4114 [Hermanssonia centrifuga]|uniref:CxC2-like cysteine cluster KDZ transposase-associated domain-containing protein n=1 Tax=Hermanssonia centrifuga TaxID=98765 RepID=A0A2R6Q283_9APHY|nr:hypothetical protein PHLCEN_2v4114 [Hermanssonia centrifuga]